MTTAIENINLTKENTIEITDEVFAIMEALLCDDSEDFDYSFISDYETESDEIAEEKESDFVVLTKSLLEQAQNQLNEVLAKPMPTPSNKKVFVGGEMEGDYFSVYSINYNRRVREINSLRDDIKRLNNDLKSSN